MDLENRKQHTENGEAEVRDTDRFQGDPGAQAVNRETLPLLAAYGDTTLSIEAANQLVQMTEDTSHPAHAGEDLPLADKAALLRNAALAQKTR